MDKNNLNALDEINKGACMGRDSIMYVLDKVKDKKLKKVLSTQLDEYNYVIKKIGKLYEKNSNKEPHETNVMTKVMTYYGIEMRIMMDDSASKIAELYIKGTNMGIIEGRKLLNNKSLIKKVHLIVEEFVDMQEEWLEKLKCFL